MAQQCPKTVTPSCTYSGAAEQHEGFTIEREGDIHETWGAGEVGVRWESKVGREKEIEGQTRFPLDGLAAENVPLLGK